MAVDDNTLYELSGSQAKDLAARIKSKATNTTFLWNSGAMYDTNNNAVTASDVASAFVSGTVVVNDIDDGHVGKIVAYDIYGNYPDEHGGLYRNVSAFTVEFTSYDGIATRKQYVNQPDFTGWLTPRVISTSGSTYSDFTGATSSTAGTHGLVPAPAAGDEAKVLSGAGTWVNQSGGGGSSSVTYYATSDSTQGFPTFYTYLYSDSARTTVVTPDTILNNFEDGDTILIEYESTQTGSSAYKMTLAVETVAKVGADSYRMNVSEINIAAGAYNAVETQFVTTWDGQSSFNGRWTLARNRMPTVNDGTLTIQQNGTTVGTFTANQSGNTTVSLAGGIYADDPTAPANPSAWIAGSDIDWTTLSENQSGIRKIHYTTFTATTDSNGFANVPTTAVTPSTGMILATSTTTLSCFTTPFNDSDHDRFTIKTESWDRTSAGNTTVVYRISYILY